MKTNSILHICLWVFLYIFNGCDAFKILGIFPYNGRSHHIFFSSLMEELASRQHEVTVINYFPLKKMPKLHQISLQDKDNESDLVNVEEVLSFPVYFKEFFMGCFTAKVFKDIANTNCEKLMKNKEIQAIIRSGVKYDLVIAEQFVSDCGLAVAHELNVPVIGMAAHVLMPWTYSRLGAPNHPAFVPNHFFGSGSKPDLWNKIKGAILNFGLNLYYKHIIQRSDHEIIKQFLPKTPDLEILAKNVSLIMLNQYFPLTGSRLYGTNVIEVGGMHIKNETYLDKELKKFVDNAENGVVYISFGSVASNMPRDKLKEVLKVIEKSDMRFVWKVENVNNWSLPKNLYYRNWLPQPAILCHPKVVAFVTHSGMLSSSETMHCGVPVVSIPLFGDQFANAAAAVESGLGVTLDLATIDKNVFQKALNTVLSDRYQNRAKHLSQLWRNRPKSPMDTAVYWVEYVAKYKGNIEMKPPTVELPLYQYLMIDVILVLGSLVSIIFYVMSKIIRFVLRQIFGKQSKTKICNKKDLKRD